MPEGVIPTITPITSSASTVLGVGIVSNNKNGIELRNFAEKVIIPHLMSVQGVADVNRFGGSVEQIQIQIDPNKLVKHDISINQVIDAVKNSTGLIGGGFIENNNQRIIINTDGQSKNVEDFKKTPIINGSNQIIFVDQIANVIHGAAP